ncbi:flagellar hook-length control protein FliK [Bradymonas sediminis]|nr:flagellar hook-length control protein FliK [Bradymonas sediminis]
MLAQKAGASSDGKSRGAFGEKLRDGRVQIGAQAEASGRARTERQVGEGHREKRVEQRQVEGHQHRVGREAGEGERAQTAREIGAKRDEQIQQKVHHKMEDRAAEQQGARRNPGANQSALGARDAQKSDPATSRAALEEASGAAGAEGGGISQAQPGSEPRVETAATKSSNQAERREQVAKIARALVEKTHIGTDSAGRQVMLMELEVPGRGQIRVRLRRRGEGYELRMRPENQDLARDLRQERDTFRESAARNGVSFSSIEIV